MQNTDSMMELLSGYEAYSSVEEINLSAASEAPATTPACIGTFAATFGVATGAMGISYFGGKFFTNQIG